MPSIISLTFIAILGFLLASAKGEGGMGDSIIINFLADYTIYLFPFFLLAIVFNTYYFSLFILLIGINILLYSFIITRLCAKKISNTKNINHLI